MDKKTYETLQIRQAQDLKNKKKREIIISLCFIFISFFFMFIIVRFNLTNDRYPDLNKRWPFKWGQDERNLEKMMMICVLTPILIASYLFLLYRNRKVEKILNSSSIKNNNTKTII